MMIACQNGVKILVMLCFVSPLPTKDAINGVIAIRVNSLKELRGKRRENMVF